MPSPFHGINVASSALRAFQRAMETVGHNMANVNTKGYSRQVVEFQALEPSNVWSFGRKALGSGTAIHSINRARSEFVEARKQAALGDFGRSTALASGLKGIEGVYQEPGDLGISHALDKFFNAWSALSSNPSDSTTRFNLRQASLTLTQRVRNSYTQLEEIQKTIEGDVNGILDRVNELGNQIAKMNDQIRQSVSMGESPNDLMDQRGLALNELSQLINISTVSQSDGTISVYVSNAALVSQAQHHGLPTNYDAASGSLLNPPNPNIPIRSGELLGHLQALTRIEQAKGELDAFANQLRTAVNALHTTGTNSQGNTNVRFFNDATPQTGAANFDLDPAILTSHNAIASGTSGNAGDGGLALAISNLRATQITGLGNRTFNGYYRDAVGQLSSDAGYYANFSQTSENVVAQIDEQIQSISGVSLDDEMADLMRFQRSYQAAAKVLSIMDQTTEDLINMVR